MDKEKYNIDLIKKLHFDDGLSLTNIANSIGCSTAKISLDFKKLNLVPNKSSITTRQERSKYEISKHENRHVLSDEARQKISNTNKLKGIRPPESGQFIKGHIPLNKGSKIFETRICKLCQKDFSFYKKSNNSGEFCSRKCSYVFRTGNNHSGYKTGKTITSNGYIRDNFTRRYEHVLVAEKALGRKLLGGEVVHHLDCNKQNNSIDNLYVCTSSEHQKLHHVMSELYAKHVYGGKPLEKPNLSSGILLSTLPVTTDFKIEPDLSVAI